MEQGAIVRARAPAAATVHAPRTDTPNRHDQLRLVTIVKSFAPGGVERVALRLNAEWRRTGVSARVITASTNGKDDASAGTDYAAIPDGGWFGRHFRTLWMLWHLPAMIRAGQADVIFCPGNTYTLIVVLLKIVLGAECPPIMAKISNDLHRRDMNPALRFFYHRWLWLQGRLIDQFVAISPAMADEIHQRMKVGPDRVAVINDPVLSAGELFECGGRALRPGRSGRRFIAVGRLVPQKNFALLLDAFAQTARGDDRLIILGDGVERTALERQAVRLGIAARVAMPGHVADVRSWLADADIFCMSSNFEGVPAVVIEAIAAGLPVVSTDCSAGMTDLIGHGRFGKLVPLGDARALALAMDMAPVGRDLSEEAMSHVRTFTMEAGAVAYIALARSIFERHETRHSTRV